MSSCLMVTSFSTLFDFTFSFDSWILSVHVESDGLTPYFFAAVTTIRSSPQPKS